MLCGRDIIELAFKILDPNLQLKNHFNDGDFIEAGRIIASGTGNAQAILSLERVMLNLVQHLCGISTKTRSFVDLITHTKAVIRV